MKYPKDPYNVEYSMIEEVELLREGIWNGYPYDKEFMEELTETYDINILRAPLQRDHWGNGSSDAIGHVLNLKLVDDVSPDGEFSVVGTVGFLEEGKDLIESGKVNERSISWTSWYPMEGLSYLLHLMLIGDSNPASVGMKPITFSPEKKEKATIDLVVKGSLEGSSLLWSADEDSFIYKIRADSRFIPESIRLKWLDKAAGLQGKIGQLKLEYVGENNPSDYYKQSVIFLKAKNWTLKKAKEWIQSQVDSGELSKVNNYDDLKIVEITNDPEVNKSSRTLDKDNTVGASSMDNSNELRSIKNMAENDVNVGTTDLTGPPVPIPVPIPAPIPISNPQAFTVAVEPESADDLERQNTVLQKQLEIQTKKNLQLKQEYAKKLKATVQDLKTTTIETEVDKLLVEEYITPAYKESGLIAILAALPDEDFTLQGKEIGFREALYRILELNGKLKIKHEFKSKLSELAGSSIDEFEGLEKTGNAKNLDLARIAGKIQEDEGIPYGAAIAKAIRKYGGDV